RCGRKLYDDYVELKPGALKEFQMRLDQLSNPPVTSAAPGQGAAGATRSGGSPVSTALNWLTGFAGASHKKTSGPCIPMHNTTATGACHSSAGPKPQRESLHLLLCMRDGRHATSLYQDGICEVGNDRQLFEFLQHGYKHRRGKLYSWLSLRVPEAINLVKVPPTTPNATTTTTCACLPPPDRVEPQANAEYRCMPIPAKLCPPIGPELLMHCFNAPGCLQDDTQSWMLAQFPKRLRGELMGTSTGPVEGWGIHFREGWNWDRIGWLLAAYVSMSLAFGIAWWVAKEDVQGASGVAGYLVSTATVFLGWVATRGM
ncbi:hypothetical protein BK809_0002944, partial [Diplodia seriata]